MATGAVAGLVGITPAAGFVNPGSGMLIGAITSVLCYLSVQLKIKLSFDDSLDTRWNSPWELMDGRPLKQDEINILFEYENLMLGIVDNNQESKAYSMNPM